MSQHGGVGGGAKLFEELHEEHDLRHPHPESGSSDAMAIRAMRIRRVFIGVTPSREAGSSVSVRPALPVGQSLRGSFVRVPFTRVRPARAICPLDVQL